MQQLLVRFWSNALMPYSYMTFKAERFWMNRHWMEWKEYTGLKISSSLLYAQITRSYFVTNILKHSPIWKKLQSSRQAHLTTTMLLCTQQQAISNTSTRALTRMESLSQWKTLCICLTLRMDMSFIWTEKVRWKSSRWTQRSMNSKLHLRIKSRGRLWEFLRLGLSLEERL